MTLFVPEDRAFDLLDENVTARLFQTTPDAIAFIEDVILYHILGFNLHRIAPDVEASVIMLNNVSAWLTNHNPNNDTVINDATMLHTYVASNG